MLAGVQPVKHDPHGISKSCHMYGPGGEGYPSNKLKTNKLLKKGVEVGIDIRVKILTFAHLLLFTSLCEFSSQYF